MKSIVAQAATRLASAAPPVLLRSLRRRPLIWRIALKLEPLLLDKEATIIASLREGHLAGRKLAVSRSSMRYFWLGGHDEPAVADALASLATPGSSALDIGAHVGIETVLLADRVGSTGLVVSVEPDPRSARLLRKSCELNDLANVRVVEAVVSDTSGRASFMLEDDSTTSHIGLEDPSGKTGSGVASTEKQPLILCSITVDQIVEEVCSPLSVSVVKIDVEGHEASVLKGAQKTLLGGNVSVIVEVHTDAALRECVALLRSYNLSPTTLGNNEYFEAALSGTGGRGATFARGHLVARPG